MHMSKKFWRIALLFSFVSLNASGQDFTAALNAFHSSNPQEKIYLHYDKDQFVAGETIWFKAYLFNNGAPSFLSTNFYVQLTDSSGKSLEVLKFPISGATVKGSINLPDSLPQGAYNLRAFTPATLNFTPAELSYRKGIFVFNPSTRKPITAAAPDISLQFFPESGHLVHGLTSVLAFMATDQYARPVAINGTISTADGFTIPIKTDATGMGKLNFKPDAAKTYKASYGEGKIVALPAVQRSGINLHVEDEKGGKLFTLSRSNTDKNNFQRLIIVAQINNQVVYEQEVDFDDYPSVKGHLVTDKLPSGILHFTVFNKDGAPLAERLSFVDNREYESQTAIASIQKNLKKRGENIIEISNTDSLQKTLSVSIIDESLSNSDRQSIISRFLLTSELKGHVYNAAAYFEKPFDSVKQQLDNLMLTQGWSRFSWKKILSNDFPEKKYNDPYLITVKGTVRDEKGNTVKGGQLNVYVESEDSTTQSFDVNVLGDGRFALDSLLFYGNAKFYYSYFQNGKAKNAVFAIDSAIRESFPADNFAPASLQLQPVQLTHTELVKRYQFSKDVLGKSKSLEPVVLETSSNKKPVDIVNEKYTTGPFRTPSKINIDNINQPTPNKTINPLDYAMNNIRQLELQGGNLVNSRTVSLASGAKWSVAIFVDEVPADPATLRVFRMDEIALIKFYDPGFVGAGSNGPGGALAIYTKKQQQAPPKNVKMDYVTYKGYAITREFYNPDYAVPNIRHDLPDVRTTLYWNSAIFLDAESNKTSIRFFNNDHSKQLRMVIEGFTGDGKLVHIEKLIE